jgi:hypothetical protein
MTIKQTIMDVLKNLGITSAIESVQALKEQCIEVFETTSMIFNPIADERGNFNLIEDGYHTVSNANGNIHGKVSKSGSVLQMTDLIDIAYDVSLSEGLNLDFKKANLNYFKDESICTLNIPLGTSKFITANGFQDETKIELFIKTGFGGTACSEVGIYSHRFVCSNGMEVRHGLNYFKAKHTEKMNELAKTFLYKSLPLMMNSVDNFTQNAEKMDRALITNEQIEAFRQSMFNYKKDDEIKTKKQNMIDAFNNSLAIEQSRAGQTAWTLLQGATNYTNHAHYNSSEEFIITGSGATFNAKAEAHCLAL